MIDISPEPTADEAAAIAAAIDAVMVEGPVEAADETPRWRWSGRWWSKPVPIGRVRPW